MAAAGVAKVNLCHKGLWAVASERLVGSLLEKATPYHIVSHENYTGKISNMGDMGYLSYLGVSG